MQSDTLDQQFNAVADNHIIFIEAGNTPNLMARLIETGVSKLIVERAELGQAIHTSGTASRLLGPTMIGMARDQNRTNLTPESPALGLLPFDIATETSRNVANSIYDLAVESQLRIVGLSTNSSLLIQNGKVLGYSTSPDSIVAFRNGLPQVISNGDEIN